MKDPIQEQLAAARRDQILDAAAHVFAAKGYHAATIKDIAAQAGIADGTIYLYFENKAALLLGIFERMRGTVLQDMETTQPSAGDAAAFIRDTLWQPLRALRHDNFELFRVVVAEMLVNEEMRALYREQILEPTLAFAEQSLQHLADQHIIRTDNIPLTVRTMMAMVLGLALHQAVQDNALDAQAEEMVDHAADLLLAGLRGEQ